MLEQLAHIIKRWWIDIGNHSWFHGKHHTQIPPTTYFFDSVLTYMKGRGWFTSSFLVQWLEFCISCTLRKFRPYNKTNLRELVQLGDNALTTLWQPCVLCEGAKLPPTGSTKRYGSRVYLVVSSEFYESVSIPCFHSVKSCTLAELLKNVLQFLSITVLDPILSNCVFQ